MPTAGSDPSRAARPSPPGVPGATAEAPGREVGALGTVSGGRGVPGLRIAGALLRASIASITDPWRERMWGVQRHAVDVTTWLLVLSAVGYAGARSVARR